MPAPRVLVVGTGWAATSFLRAIRKPTLLNMTVASRRDHMLFTPLLASTATGALEHRSIMEPIRPLATKKRARFLNAEGLRVESAQDMVHFRAPSVPLLVHGEKESAKKVNGEFSEKYDLLVLGVGAMVNTFNVPGVKEHALFMKEASDAIAVRKRMHDLFEAAALPMMNAHQRRALLTFIVCGAGPTGVELTAEIGDWMADVARSRRYGDLAAEARVVLVEASGDILSAFDESLREYALSRLRANRVEVKLGSAVHEVHKNSVVLRDSTSNGDEKELQERLPCGMVVWTAGIGPRPVIAASDLPKNERGTHVLTDSYMLADVKGAPVFAIGDCSHIDGNPHLPIAQVAEQQGIYVANLLDNAKSLNVDDLRAAGDPFKFASKGMLAYVGGWRGIAAVKTGSENPNSLMVQLSGRTAWLLWRLAYLSKVGSLRNKLQVPFDWFKTMIFGRDVSSF